ncbi:MAG: phosphatase PAP2 family protein [Oscillospiraceae bacterium]|nr:phosphatase PAP2 family protein [Oscillospiraceae bacterium]
MKTRSRYAPAAVFGALFLIWIVLLKTVDVAAVGPEGTSVGFSHLNVWFHSLTGVNLTWYQITNVLGYLSIATVLVFALTGLVQWIGRKSIAEVDGDLLRLGGLCVALGTLYAAFEKIIINYRPIILPDEPTVEASFPSSHTLLVCAIFGCLLIVAQKRVKNTALRRVLVGFCAAAVVLGVVGRLLSGVHWLTDIIGSLLLSAALLALFAATEK